MRFKDLFIPYFRQQVKPKDKSPKVIILFSHCYSKSLKTDVKEITQESRDICYLDPTKPSTEVYDEYYGQHTVVIQYPEKGKIKLSKYLDFMSSQPCQVSISKDEFIEFNPKVLIFLTYKHPSYWFSKDQCKLNMFILYDCYMYLFAYLFYSPLITNIYSCDNLVRYRPCGKVDTHSEFIRCCALCRFIKDVSQRYLSFNSYRETSISLKSFINGLF